MDDDDREVERVVREAFAALERVDVALPNTEMVEARVRLLRRRRRARRMALAAGIMLVALGAALGWRLTWSSAPGTPATARPAPPQVADWTPMPFEPAELRRIAPRPGLVLLAAAGADVRVEADGGIRLRAGRLALEFHAVGAEAVLIETPVAVVTITGTIAAITTEPSGTGVEVVRGEARVSLHGGPTVVVGPDRMLSPGATTPMVMPPERGERLARLFDESDEPRTRTPAESPNTESVPEVPVEVSVQPPPAPPRG